MSRPTDEISSYLLGELEAEAAAAFERRTDGDPTLRAEVERLRPLVARLDALPDGVWNPPEPPPLSMPEGALESPPRWTRRPRLPSLSLRPAPAAALAAALIGLGVVAGVLLEGGGGGDPATAAGGLVLSRIDGGPAGAHGRVLVSGRQTRATVDVGGLEPTTADRFYELWLLGDDGRMIALGSFRVDEDGHADVQLPIPVAPSHYRYFDISLQEDNGDPTHSGVSVLRGSTSS